MSAKLKKLSDLSKRGPHRVLEGDLGYTGLPGKVYTPAEGKNLPAVAFGHDWTKDIDDYHGTLRHLASWGIAVAAPNTETGFRPDHRGFAADLETSLQILAGVRLGNGNISVSPGKLGIVGHGMGGGAAVLAAVDNPKVKAVATVYPANVAPSAVEAARALFAPGMVIGPGEDGDSLFDPGNPAKLAYNWAGDVVYRAPKKGDQQSFSEDGMIKRILGLGKSDRALQETVRGLLVGYLLHVLNDEKAYAGYAEADAEGSGVVSLSGEKLAKAAGLARDNAGFSLF
ncbi:Dienelactone hydrolase [Corynebacterium coyleae]|uniref:Dienelactone hydrolase family protein n=1 Tax=Corynebacterium coyleae TaxID=53374 RepID=A0ABX8KTU4_9CORY|nr:MULTISPECIES: dienelactone hydrolase family protein [Corynebacterium]MDK8823579.1 dienelactone hydrolase family protein [Corynebacterium coyleae]OFU57415.1 alpha/beta hydrolase [Corynebacterium sp. HMSC11D10]OHO32703.1 alpha/beta hydrolase [Corynebacterium sp. HMSC034E11]QXB17680.1 dienelactone hydrolase family protein [Corynebacterium coyleae]WJY79072.1 Alpha/beta hydrolase family protein [Corynebacterium coyleae]